MLVRLIERLIESRGAEGSDDGRAERTFPTVQGIITG